MRDIRRDSQANRRWNKVPRGGGKIAKQIAKSEAAMEGKIEPRNCELLPITPASAPSFLTSKRLLVVQFFDDCVELLFEFTTFFFNSTISDIATYYCPSFLRHFFDAIVNVF